MADNLVVVLERLARDGKAFGEDEVGLTEAQRIALEGCRGMRPEIPNLH